MITKEERNLALDKIHPSFFTVLKSWLTNERENLQSFINKPTTHVEYNPFAIIDTEKLQLRIEELHVNMTHLATIESYMANRESVTEVQIDYALDGLSHVFVHRALDWIKMKRDGYISLVDKNTVISPPNGEYNDLIQIDFSKIEYQILKFSLASEGLEVIHTYLVELSESLENPND